MTIEELIRLIRELFDAGGIVMPPLLLCALLLWYGLGYRFSILKTSRSMGVRDMLKFYQEDPGRPAKSIVEQAVQQGVTLKNKHVGNLKQLRRFLDAAFYEYEKEIKSFSVLVKTVVVISPLLGLLGTVVGMVETFDSLASMALFTQSGGIAGGISQALFSTQMGLAVAIPGLLVHSILNKKQQQIEKDLRQIKSLLCSQPITS